ncbi:hypothetical protein D3C72_2109790 [compost metagenome]
MLLLGLRVIDLLSEVGLSTGRLIVTRTAWLAVAVPDALASARNSGWGVKRGPREGVEHVESAIPRGRSKRAPAAARAR